MFFVRSEEIVPCPCCQGHLGVIGSRKRKCIQGSGEVIILVIRRMRCEKCGRIHHELPDMLVPYKRYEAASIERVVAVPGSTDTAADESTLRRWHTWFVAWSRYAVRCLSSISIRFNLPVKDRSNPLQTSLQSLGRFVGDATGWLARVVRPIANENLWVQTRSAFMS